MIPIRPINRWRLFGWAYLTFWQKRGVAQLCKLCGQRQSVPLTRRTPNHRHRLPVAAQVANLCYAPARAAGEKLGCASFGFAPGILLVVLGAAVCSAADFGDWRDTISKERGTFPMLRPVKVHYEFGWSGFTAAEADASFFRNASGQCELDLKAKTTGTVRSLWKMDTSASSTCNPTTLRPAKLQQTEIYSKKTLTTTVDFSGEGAAQFRVRTPAGNDTPKIKKFCFPDLQDLNSALLFIRSQPLAQGDSVKICVYPASAPYLATITVLGREKIKVAGRKWDAIKADLKLTAVKGDFTLKPHSKFKKATAWLSDDQDRLLLKVEAEVFVGSVWAELQRVEFPEGKSRFIEPSNPR